MNFDGDIIKILSAAALAFLLLKPNYTSLLFSLIVFSLIIGKKDTLKIQTLININSILVSILLTYNFYTTWITSSLVTSVRSFFKFGHALFAVACVLIGIVASLMVNSLINAILSNKKSQITTSGGGILDIIFVFTMSIYIMMATQFRPFSVFRFDQDESVYMYIGKSMLIGRYPYKDIFDHKGIILYFLNYLGFLINRNNYYGIILVCGVNAFFAAMMMLKTFGLLSKNKVASYTSVYLIFNLFAFQLDNNINSTEFFSLPWIMLAIYECVKYFKDKIIRSKDVALMGISTIMVFFLRCNNIACNLVLIFIIAVDLIKNKEYKKLLKCFKLFLIGLLIVLIPLFMYFLCTESFWPMIEDYFIFNLSYTESRGSITAIRGTMRYLYVMIVDSIVLLLFISFNNKITSIRLFLVFFATLLSASVSGRHYPHYAMVLLPIYSIFLFDVIYKSLDYFINNSKLYTIVLYCSIVLIGFFVCVEIKDENPIVETQYIQNNEINDYILSNTSEDDTVLCIGSNVAVNMYTNRFTNNKYVYQRPPIDFNETIYNDFLEEITNNPSDYIICTHDENDRVHKFLTSIDLYSHELHNGFCVFIYDNN